MNNAAIPTNTNDKTGAASLDELEAKALACIRSAPWKVQHPHMGVTGFEVADHSGLNQICGRVTEELAQFIAAANPAVILQLVALARQATMRAELVACIKCEGRGSYAVMDATQGVVKGTCTKCGGSGKVLASTDGAEALAETTCADISTAPALAEADERSLYEAWELREAERLKGEPLTPDEVQYVLKRWTRDRDTYERCPHHWPAFQAGLRAAGALRRRSLCEISSESKGSPTGSL
jgi:hypothetical protein